MVGPRKVEDLDRAPPTIASCREEDAALRKWPWPVATVLVLLRELHFFVHFLTTKKEKSDRLLIKRINKFNIGVRFCLN
jgi:hypothetical protein